MLQTFGKVFELDVKNIISIICNVGKFISLTILMNVYKIIKQFRII